MRQQALDSTRRTLHGLAELVLAGPQYAQSQSIRLRVTPRGFGTIAEPPLRLEGLELVSPTVRLPLAGTYADLARAVGVEARTLQDVYAGGPAVELEDPVVVDPEAHEVILRALTIGDAGLRAFAPHQEPVLWPEHFDIATTVADVNYGVSPGDAYLPQPYAYVGPWTPRTGTFWNAPFGATRTMTELPDSESLVGFFQAGAQQAADDPPQA